MSHPGGPANGSHRSGHPVVFSILIIPFGASSGFVTVALAYLCTKRGLTVQDGAGLVALAILPHVWKFFWSPIADTTLSRRRWYLIANSIVGLGMFAVAAVPLGPATLHLIQLIVLLTSTAAPCTDSAICSGQASRSETNARPAASGHSTRNSRP